MTLPLPVLWQCQTKAWVKEEGDANLIVVMLIKQILTKQLTPVFC